MTEFSRWVQSTSDSSLLCMVHDRLCCDAMGTVLAFAEYARSFGKTIRCIQARPRSHPMSERLYADVVAGKNIFSFGELIEDQMEDLIQNHTTLFAFDTSSPQNCGYFPYFASKKLYVLDHHEKGIEYMGNLPQSELILQEDAQSASALILDLLLKENKLPCEQDTLLALSLGVYQDTILLKPQEYSPMTRNAFSLLENLLTPATKEEREKIKQTPYPLCWQQCVSRALQCPVKNDALVMGLGIIDNPGVLSYVADHLLEAQKASTVIVLGLAHEQVGKRRYLDFVASGRSKGSYASQLPALFETVFYLEKDGQLISRGGGKITGNVASCAACVPLPQDDPHQAWQKKKLRIQEDLLALGFPAVCMTFDNGTITS